MGNLSAHADRTLDLDGEYAEEPDRPAPPAGDSAPALHRHPLGDPKKVGLLYRLASRPEHLYRMTEYGPVAVAASDDETEVLVRSVPGSNCPACVAHVPHTSAFHRQVTGGADIDEGDGETTYGGDGGDDEYSQVARRPAPAARGRRR